MPEPLIDKGGAELRRGTKRDMRESFRRAVRTGDTNELSDEVADRATAMFFDALDAKRSNHQTGMSVTVQVVETHDGVPCDCIDKKNETMTLRVGDTIELTHTCHDGRVDVIKATVESIDLPVEHATVRKT